MRRLHGLGLPVVIALAVPIAGFLIAFPLWYVGTSFRLAYTIVFLVIVLARIVLRVTRSHARRS